MSLFRRTYYNQNGEGIPAYEDAWWPWLLYFIFLFVVVGAFAAVVLGYV